MIEQPVAKVPGLFYAGTSNMWLSMILVASDEFVPNDRRVPVYTFLVCRTIRKIIGGQCSFITQSSNIILP
jgi:hypothetical protein